MSDTMDEIEFRQSGIELQRVLTTMSIKDIGFLFFKIDNSLRIAEAQVVGGEAVDHVRGTKRLLQELLYSRCAVAKDYETKVKNFFRECMLALWEEGEGFSGKRPFGDSGWEYDVLDFMSSDEFTDEEKRAEVRRIIRSMK